MSTQVYKTLKVKPQTYEELITVTNARYNQSMDEIISKLIESAKQAPNNKEISSQ